jgi:O-glycosyl hydrolase
MRPSTSTLLLAAGLALDHASAQVTINTATKYQTIDGFGFSEAFGFGVAVQDAPAAQQTQALTYLFDKTEGAGLTILRNRIAADPSDTIEPNSPGSPSATPTYTWDGDDQSQVCEAVFQERVSERMKTDIVIKVFWSQKAREMGVEYIYADAWSAPGFMKTNDNYVSRPKVGN